MTDTPSDNPADHSEESATLSDPSTSQHTASAYKVLGQDDLPSGAAVQGHNTATSGTATGVEGVTDSTDSNAAGVRGKSMASSGTQVETYGVHGISAGDGTLSGPTPSGVKGTGTGSGENAGVLGVTQSDAGRAAGVKAVATSGFANAILADANNSGLAIEATAQADNAPAVWARTIGSSGTDLKRAILGEISTTAAGVSAVRGHAQASSGETYGVEGETASTAANAAGVHGTVSDSTGDAAAIKASGHVDIDDVGVTAYRSSNLSISNETDTTVKFDATREDHFSGFDTSNGVYTVQQAGDYHVDFMINWNSFFSAGDSIDYRLLVDGFTTEGFVADTKIPGNIAPSRCFSKTIRGMSAKETIEVEVYQSSGGSKDISGSADGDTYISIDKVG